MSMSRDDQKKFVENLTGDIRNELLRNIDGGIVPAYWDGHELRKLLADKFANEVTRLMRDGRDKRVRDYANVVATSTL